MRRYMPWRPFAGGVLIFGLAATANCKKNTGTEEAAESAKPATTVPTEPASEGAGHDEQSPAESAKPEESRPQNMAEAMKQMNSAMAKAMGAAGGSEISEAVSFRKLKELLPENAGGLKRKSSEGQKTSMMGMKLSQAEATYQGDDRQSVRVKILDLGTMSGVARMSMLGWANMEIEKESDEGFERTTTFEGHKAFEKYRNANQRGELNIFVADRFMISVRGRKADVDTLRKVAGDLPLKKLEALKDAGKSAAQ